MANRPLIIFDLDGTLVASHLDLIPALNAATATFDLPPVPMEAVGHIVGQGAKAMLAKAFEYHDRPIPDGKANLLFERFLTHYEAHIADGTEFYPNCIAALEGLSNAGFTLAVCTNKDERLAKKLLNILDGEDRFALIVGGDTYPVKKPDPKHLTNLAEELGFTASQCIMVGDSINDIAAAKAASIPSIAVTFGYSDCPISELGASMMIDDFAELAGAVTQLQANE
ncbi:HAD family hydrolase [Ahrensia sp. R2A130]|uniref:HAD family hydrolase n=1 Tax=Ahrensia sp. R2A130 TaxID=744979 RepID=UPI0001E0F06E|nr:HAD family hydrolase [Ahrensia sp. R2A130]EFL90424.1 phosphoglycolate phosphatase, bacterial [Ahrensia sp. R2A130]